MKSKPLIILLCLYFFHIISNYVWLKIDTIYQLSDCVNYLLSNLSLFEAIKDSPSVLFSRDVFISFFGRSGIFAGFVTVPFYFLFGTSQDVSSMLNSSIFLAVLLFSIYGIGRKLKDERTGLLGAFIVSMYPIVFNQLRIYMLDLPLCAFVSLNIYSIISSDHFRNKFFTVLYALTVISGALIKFNFLIFIVGPTILVLCKSSAPVKKTVSVNQLPKFKKGDMLQKKYFIILLGISVAMILSFGYRSLKLMFLHSSSNLWLNRIQYLSYLSGGNHSDKIISLVILWINSLLYFLARFVNESVSFFFSLIFIIALIIVLRLKFKYAVFLLLPILIPLFFTILIFDTFEYTVRYMLPSYVFIALISSIGVMSIKTVYMRRLIVTLILLIGFMQYFLISYGCGFFPREIKISLPDFLTYEPSVFLKKSALLKTALPKTALSYARPIPYYKYITLFQQEIPIFPHKNSSHPQKDEKNRQIINKILQSCPLQEGDTFLFLDYLQDIEEIVYPLRFEAFRKTKSMETVKDTPSSEYSQYILNWQHFLINDYIAIVDGIPKRSDLMFLPDLKEEIRKTKECFYNHLDAFKLVYKVDLPNGRVLSVYKNKLNNIKDNLGPNSP